MNWGHARGATKCRQLFRKDFLEWSEVGSQMEEGMGFGTERCAVSKKRLERVYILVESTH